MNSYEQAKTKETFSRLFVIAINNKINLDSFTNLLEKSALVNDIENNNYSQIINESLDNIFFSITGHRIGFDDSYGVYNDAYWSGHSYFDLFLKTKKPFSYLFLKLPLGKLLDIYSLFHEMDESSLFEYFHNLEQEKTILRLLCENHKCSLPKLSSDLGINLATIKKYNQSDKALYRGSFENIIKIAKYFDKPASLFIERII